jgi:transposase
MVVIVRLCPVWIQTQTPWRLKLLLARVIGVGVETADMLVQEVLSRTMRDRRAVGRYAGLTGSPDESGAKRRDKGLARSGNARVRHGMIQLAWRFLLFQKDSALARDVCASIRGRVRIARAEGRSFLRSARIDRRWV